MCTVVVAHAIAVAIISSFVRRNAAVAVVFISVVLHAVTDVTLTLSIVQHDWLAPRAAQAVCPELIKPLFSSTCSTRCCRDLDRRVAVLLPSGVNDKVAKRTVGLFFS